MEVILLERVANLGSLGDKVAVKPGYGRNFLLPYGKAVRATESNIAEFETRREELEKKANALLKSAEDKAEALKESEITITAKAGGEGKLYGSVGTQEIADALSATGIQVLKKEVCLPHGALRQVGEYEVDIRLHTEITATVKLVIVAEEEEE